MITFLRKIRRKLLADNKFSRYLAYAFGEIVLVVIGILIAITINNCNQNRAKKDKEQAYLEGLQAEFQISKNKLKELIQVNNKSCEGAKKLMTYSFGKAQSIDEAVLSRLLYETFAYDIAFNPNNSLLNEMINSGVLKDLSNPKLRISLTNWLSTLDDISKQEEDLRAQRESVLDIFRKDKYSLKTILDHTGSTTQNGLPMGHSISNMEILNATDFKNNTLLFILTCTATEASHYQPLMGEINTILELIEGERE